jgi:Flp pilus assembly pilin Flp
MIKKVNNALMKAMVAFEAFKGSRKGQAMTEYGLIIALVAVGAITVLGFVSGGIQRAFNAVLQALPAAP